MKETRYFNCVRCRMVVEARPPEIAVCKHCGAIYIYKMRSDHYVYAGVLRQPD